MEMVSTLKVKPPSDNSSLSKPRIHTWIGFPPHDAPVLRGRWSDGYWFLPLPSTVYVFSSPWGYDVQSTIDTSALTLRQQRLICIPILS